MERFLFVFTTKKTLIFSSISASWLLYYFKYLLITVRLKRKLCVWLFWKSTRQRYIPWSWRLISCANTYNVIVTLRPTSIAQSRFQLWGYSYAITVWGVVTNPPSRNDAKPTYVQFQIRWITFDHVTGTWTKHLRRGPMLSIVERFSTYIEAVTFDKGGRENKASEMITKSYCWRKIEPLMVQVVRNG